MNQSSFIEEVKKLGIEVTEEKLEKLEKYYNLILEYNKIMNLTAITDKETVYLKHFYDSLTLVKAIDLNSVETLCDLGSGAGFPGIVLKIFFPNIKITLIDSLNKRVNFLNNVIKELELRKIEAVHDRIEEYSKVHVEEYDVVTARAVASLNVLLEIGIKLVKVGKYFISMKGNIDNEPNFSNALKELNCSKVDLLEFKLPIEESNRCLIKIKKNKETPDLFPRKFSDIKNKPL